MIYFEPSSVLAGPCLVYNRIRLLHLIICFGFAPTAKLLIKLYRHKRIFPPYNIEGHAIHFQVHSYKSVGIFITDCIQMTGIIKSFWKLFYAINFGWREVSSLASGGDHQCVTSPHLALLQSLASRQPCGKRPLQFSLL